jgi:uncharacterized protein
VRSGHARRTSRKAQAVGNASAGGWLGAVGDVFRALGLTLLDAFGGGSGSKSGSSSSSSSNSSSSSSGGGGDFGGGGASGSY